jgi:hypothetical protein
MRGDLQKQHHHRTYIMSSVEDMSNVTHQRSILNALRYTLIMKGEFMHNKLIAVLIGLILLLGGGIAGAGEKPDAKANNHRKTTNVMVSKTDISLCKEVSKMIKNNTVGKYMPEGVSLNPHSTEYRNLDIDGDGKTDMVTVSSGSEESLMEVKLSNSGEYDLDENGFITPLRIRKRVYALVTYWEWERQADGSKNGKIVNRSLYVLKKQGAEIICKEIH